MVVGGGPVAASKLAALRAVGADILVVAPEVCADIRAAGVASRSAGSRPRDLDGAWFVVAAATPEVNRVVAAEADAACLRERRGRPAECDRLPRRRRAPGGVTIAISTDGAAPALAGLLREAIDAMLPPDLGAWMLTAHELRRDWRERRCRCPTAARCWSR